MQKRGEKIHSEYEDLSAYLAVKLMVKRSRRISPLVPITAMNERFTLNSIVPKTSLDRGFRSL